MPQQLPGIGADVTALMNAAPEIGADVTALMSDAPTAPFGLDRATSIGSPRPPLGLDATQISPAALRALEQLQDEGLLGSVVEGLTQGGMQAAGVQAIGAGRSLLSGLLSRASNRALKSGLKMDRSFLRKIRGRGDMAAKENEVIGTARSLGVNPLSERGAARIQSAIEDTAARRVGKVTAAPDVPVMGSGRSAVHAGRRVVEQMGKGEAPQPRVREGLRVVEDIIASPRTGETAMQRVSFQPQASSILGPSGQPITSLRAVPGREIRRARDLTPQQLAETIEETNRELTGLFGESKLGPRARTLMATSGARRGALDRVAGTRPESEQMRRLIDLRNVSQIARHRAQANNPVSLTDIISLSAGRPAVLAGSAAMKPRVLGAAGAGLGRASERITRPGALEAILPSLMRAALMEQLSVPPE